MHCADGHVNILIEPEANADADAARQAVEQRIQSEHAALGIRNAVRVQCGAVPPPTDRGKLRRFMRDRSREAA